MKKQLLVCAAAAALFASSPAIAEHGDKSGKDGMEGAIEKVIDKTVEAFTEDGNDHHHHDSKNHGRENAAEQIEKNLEKHGGEHKGLENALSNVKKDGHSHHDEEGSLIDEIIEDVADGAKDEIDEAIGDDPVTDDRRQYRGRSDSHPSGKGKD